MATLEQCRTALDELAGKMRGEGDDATATGFDRTLSATITDLGVTFTGSLHDGQLSDITTDPADKAQIRLTSSSDDLVALTSGELDVAKAWLSGRIKIEAGIRDLMTLRSML